MTNIRDWLIIAAACVAWPWILMAYMLLTGNTLERMPAWAGNIFAGWLAAEIVGAMGIAAVIAFLLPWVLIAAAVLAGLWFIRKLVLDAVQLAREKDNEHH
jgi:Zn-dependent protease with chaperone function